MSLYPGVFEGVVEVNGVSVPYYDSAPGDDRRPPVFLMHGTAGNAETSFSVIFPLFAYTRRVIALDFTLPQPSVPLSVEHYVLQAVAVITHVSPAQPVALVGHSLGAVIATATAARHADLVDSLTVISGWIKTDRSQLLRNSAWQAMARAGIPELAEFTVYTGYSPNYLAGLASDVFDAWIARARKLWSNPDLFRLMDLNRRIDLSGDMAAITAPTLVVVCRQDQMVPVKHSRELFGAIEDARYAEIDSGHAVVQERPIELYFLIDKFVDDPQRTGAGDVLVTSEQ